MVENNSLYKSYSDSKDKLLANLIKIYEQV